MQQWFGSDNQNQKAVWYLFTDMRAYQGLYVFFFLSLESNNKSASLPLVMANLMISTS